MMLTVKQVCIILLSIQACTHADTFTDIKMERLNDLKSLLYSEESWVKVHVAEFLLQESQFVDEVRAEFYQEEQRFGHVPKYRIGIWRVLARAAETTDERERWENKIIMAYRDLDGPDRLHAIETLAKLRRPVSFDRENLYSMLESAPDAFAIYSLWNSAYHPDENIEKIQKVTIGLLEKQLAAGQFQLLPVTSFVIRNMKPYNDEDWSRVYTVATTFEGTAAIRAGLLATAWMTMPEAKADKLSTIKRTLLALKDEEGVLMQILQAFAAVGDTDDVQTLLSWYRQIADNTSAGYDADAHAAASYALLKMGERACK